MGGGNGFSRGVHASEQDIWVIKVAESKPELNSQTLAIHTAHATPIKLVKAGAYLYMGPIYSLKIHRGRGNPMRQWGRIHQRFVNVSFPGMILGNSTQLKPAMFQAKAIKKSIGPGVRDHKPNGLRSGGVQQLSELNEKH